MNSQQWNRESHEAARRCAPATDILIAERARGRVRASFNMDRGSTRLERLFEEGGLRLRFPQPLRGCDVVVVNTAGGMAGGDRAQLSFSAGPGAKVTIATQSAERIYRGGDPMGLPAAEVALALSVGPGACLRWLPQETILFDRARLSRRLEADLDRDASLTIFESFVFGRLAAGETRIAGSLRDSWRVRRLGRMIFADEMRLEGQIGAILDRPACGGAARACATLLYMASDAEAYVGDIRARLEALDARECGASAWDGKLVVRLLSRAPESFRRIAVAVLEVLPGGGAPRVWG